MQSNDLKSYVLLWHEAFLGWPSVSATPVSKEHITDWITAQTTKGWRFQTVEVKPAAIRITHAWRRDGKGWQIIGGMSMPESASAPK